MKNTYFNFCSPFNKSVFNVIIAGFNCFIIIHFGRFVFDVSKGGLTGIQWGICFAFSAVTIVFDAILRHIPLQRYIEEKKENDNDNEDELRIQNHI